MASSREGHYREIRKRPWGRYYTAEIRDQCKRTMDTFDTTEEAKPKTNFPAPSSKAVLSSKKSKPSKSEEKIVIVKAPLNQIELPKPTHNGVKLARKDLQKGVVSNGRSRRAHASINDMQPLSHGSNKSNSCGSSIKCRCTQIPSKSQHASIKRSLGSDLRKCSAADATTLDCKGKITLTSSLMSKSDNIQRSVGAVSALVHESVCLSSQLTTPTTYALLTPIVNLQMSPKKALRAAMLKSRFADTILKAQQNLLLVHGAKSDPVKMQQEKEKFERRLHEEMAKIEAQIRAAEAAPKLKAEIELKKQREKEREAARIALQRMENTAGIELNLEIVKELDILSGCSLSRGNPLHQLGLFIKDEYLKNEDNEACLNQDLEEGEILL